LRPPPCSRLLRRHRSARKIAVAPPRRHDEFETLERDFIPLKTAPSRRRSWNAMNSRQGTKTPTLELRVSIRSGRTARARLLAMVERLLEGEEARLSRGAVDEISLALSEAFANVARHAYPSGEGPIDLRLSIVGPTMCAVIRDEGVPPQPEQLEPREPVPSQSGGRGLWLLSRTMDRVEYRRQGGANLWTLTRNLRCAAGRAAHPAGKGRAEGIPRPDAETPRTRGP
jgi:serine/threonine-protein kinase RsbW